MYKGNQINYVWRNYYLQIVDSIIYEAYVDVN